ncbi:SRPBCC family protein [Flaviaesturariibacter flavus]|uniref:SRPBCC family protein n=1 Tax=Flaviaesturariibacter flavus TaxID=2502780 RepID=UPI0014046460|nr:SRPBCC family protein [Flaviaesturariibacter flavus]
MRIVKLALLSAFFIFLLWTLISLLIPSRVRISRAANISAPKERVQALVNDSSQWRTWHPWLADSNSSARNIRFTFRERSDTLTVALLQHPGVRDLEQAFRYYQLGGANTVTVQWYSDIHLRWYPWEKFSSLFFEQSYGAMMEAGIRNLKQQAEAAK